MKHIVILSGAGISAESGLKTFRDADGLWEGHDVMKVASPQGFKENPELVLDFYNQRRRQLKEVLPNPAHFAIADLERDFKVNIITQNVDDLHERAGSTSVIHLHGELFKVRSVLDDDTSYTHTSDIVLGDLAPDGGQLRPDIVWFGEAVPMMERAVEVIQSADVVIVVGSSMQVYPAASLVGYAPRGIEVYYVDPNPQVNSELAAHSTMKVVQSVASKGIPEVIAELYEKYSST